MKRGIDRTLQKGRFGAEEAMRFTYRSGDKPLEGYTIKRGVGQGGFGEVYFAVSDGGKEVALKLLHGRADIELRGVANCLNLKHPNLVHVYDLKNDERGNPWLIMEYVVGESLAQVIERKPQGLAPNLAKEWFLSLTRAVGYLHDHGVVHRDLKPANIFVEHGALKVGDYGLCKSVGASRQTKTVGTVHYMAPEISTGDYGKAVDIYACGIILYEMMTGKIPFDGESDGEILMKHLTAIPDVALVPEPFRSIVARTLDKNPLRRYATAAELARAVETAVPTITEVPSPPVAVVEVRPPRALRAPGFQKALPYHGPTGAEWLHDVTSGLLLAPLLLLLIMAPILGLHFLEGDRNQLLATWNVYALTLMATAAGIAGGAGRLCQRADGWAGRLRMAGLGALTGLTTWWLAGHTLPGMAGGEFGFSENPVSTPLAHYLLYFAISFAVPFWWRLGAKDRKEHFSWFPVIVVGLLSSLFWVFSPWREQGRMALLHGTAPLALAAIVVQLVSPWEPPVIPSTPKKWKL